jgi:chemotaxis protein methyltransferase CheR
MTGTETQAIERDFHFSERDFAHVRRLIHQHAGINLSEAKREMVYSRLTRRLRAIGERSFSAYLEQLQVGVGAEWEAFVNALTTNLTAFFREPHHFDALREFLRRREHPASIWCCAASTGEEPYSILITAQQAAAGAGKPVRLLATDIDTNVLAKARAGVYDLEQAQKLPPEVLRRFFLRGTGANTNKVRVRPELQQLVEFRQLNLLDKDWGLRGPFDAIFCRNVMIYFDKATQLGILRRFAPLLRSDGLLFVGHSESFTHATDLFRLQGKTIYQPVCGSGSA